MNTRPSSLLRAALAGLLLVATASSASAQQVLHVDRTATGANTGASWADAFTDLQAALAVVVSGQEVWVAEGIYFPDEQRGSQSGDRRDSFQLGSGVILYGSFPAGGGDGSFGARRLHAFRTVLSGDIGVPGDVSDNSYHVVSGDNTNATAVLDGFVISGGNADGMGLNRQGGGMTIRGGSATVRSCVFEGNRAIADGGGIAVFGSPLVVNCLFVSNAALGRGGGMYNDGGSQLILNCTFVGNSAGTTGGALHNLTSVSAIVNCILWRNGNAPVGGPPTVTFSCVEGGHPGTGNIQLDPGFVDEDGGDLRLAAGSPCEDAGMFVASLPPLDLAGGPRLVGDEVDMGAYERQPTGGSPLSRDRFSAQYRRASRTR